MNLFAYLKFARISSPIKTGVTQTQRLLNPAGSKYLLVNLTTRQHSHSVGHLKRNHSLALSLLRTVSCPNVSFSGYIKGFYTATTMGAKTSRQMDNTKKSDGQDSQGAAATSDSFIEVVVAKASDFQNGQ